MPLPKPGKGESQRDFMARCASSDAVKEFKDQKQMTAVCFAQYRRRDQQLMIVNLLQDWSPASRAENARGVTAFVREETKNGLKFLVAPAVVIVEGVLNKWFVPSAAIAASASNWNGVPLTINHPHDDSGPIAADFADAVGTFENATYRADLKGLAGDIWVEIAKAQKTADGRAVLNKLRGGDPLELSTGYFVPQLELNKGTFAGRGYEEIHHALDPDHLALLPNATGACSWRDGCGTPRMNAEYPAPSDDQTMPEFMSACMAAMGNDYPDKEECRRACQMSWDKAKGKNASASADGTTNNDAARTGAEAANCGCTKGAMNKEQKVNALIANKRTCFAEKDRPWLMSLEDARLDEFVSHASEPVINEADRKPRVNRLIGGGEYKEDERDWLMKLDEDVFKRIETRALAVITANEASKEARINKAIGAGRYKDADKAWLLNLDGEALDRALGPVAPATNASPDTGQTLDQYVANAPEPLRSQLKAMASQEKARREALLKSLKENQACTLTAQELDGMQTDTLARLAQSYGVEDFSGVIGFDEPVINDDDPNSVPAPPRWMCRRGTLTDSDIFPNRRK
jgi:hypothetical protein